ncbi:MAG: cation:proton antiporter, partial [Alphaproteobacteria bacterium]|nr:cation:proton antiporter [Alphaproteobacteria bacterium]
IFFLVLCFIIGIFTVPTLIKKVINYMNDEMLLLTSIALCFGMVVLSTSAGFSSALGAFIMGSILAESSTVHRIENVLKPVKDFFGAVFFVSVGMMVNPAMFLQYAWPITVITLVVMAGKIFFSCVGFTLSGQPLKTSILCGFSLAQVGEFAFIIAALGMSLGVLSDYVYPIIVAVSVVTTFTTPLMIKSADKFYHKLNKKLPERWKEFLDNITSSKPDTKAEQNMWKKLFKAYFLRLFIFSVILIGIINISTFLCKPWLKTAMAGWDNRIIRVVSTTLTLIVMAPFLHALLVSKERMLRLYFNLWMEKKANRIPLIVLTAIRILLVIFFIMMATHQLLTTNPYITGLLVCGTIFALTKSKWVLNQYMRIETQFLVNLNREQLENFKSDEDEQVADEDKWLDSSLFVSQFELDENSDLNDRLMRETMFQEVYALNIIKIIRDKSVINVPRGCDGLKSGDKLLIVGSKKQLRSLASEMKAKGLTQTTIDSSEDKYVSLHDYILKQDKYNFKNDKTLLCCAIPVTKDSTLNDNTLRGSAIRNKTGNCLVVGVERKSSLTLNPKVTFIFNEGDILWLVGEQKKISQEVFRQTPIVPVSQETTG